MSLRNRSIGLPALALGACLILPGTALAVEPGIDIAAPRVAITTVDSTLSFHPPALSVEQGDYVRWSALVASVHTTTSGTACLADGLWSQSLGIAGTNFTRQFVEPPRVFGFFCMPHCTLGMTGQVTVTPLIDLTTADSAGTTMLSWNGGSGQYQVYRSDTARFTGPNTIKITPDGGSGGTTLRDLLTPPPALGAANYYLVMDLF